MLTKKTIYAIHALLHLAKEYEKGPILISQISIQEVIPRKFLEAILLELKSAGILNSKKGKGGGYYMAKHPNEVTLADILLLFDGPVNLLPCIAEEQTHCCQKCEDHHCCSLKNTFLKIRKEMLILFGKISLSSMLKEEKSKQILQTSSPALHATPYNKLSALR